MKKCHNCGAEFEGDYCDYCGVPAAQNSQNRTEQPQYNTDFMSGNTANQNYTPPPMYNNYGMQNNPPTTTLGWIGWQLLESFLPIIGLVIMLFMSEDESVKNYAKARLIWTLVAVVIAVIAFALFSAIIFSFIRGFA